MFKRNTKKFEIDKKSYKPRKNVNPNSFFSQSKDSVVNLHKEVFKQIRDLDKQGSNAYVVMNEKRFKHLLLSKEYVDARYIALQIYLLQENIGSFKYDEIAQGLETFVNFIEETLMKGRSISFSDVFYLSGAPLDKLLVNKTRVPRVVVFRKRPKGIVLELKDLQINLEGTREFALHELIIKHFNTILLNLLQTKEQVLLGNLLLLQLKADYAVVVSERFLVGANLSQAESATSQAPPANDKMATNLTQPMPLESIVTPKATVAKQVPKSRLRSLLYKTEQIFLHRKSKLFKADRRLKLKKAKKATPKALQPLPKPKATTLKQALSHQAQSRTLNTQDLKKEIKQVNKLIGFFKFKKRKGEGKANQRSK